ncbi:MAG: TMEM175 family protein [Candidatus Nanopelagicales bacterium]
MMSRSTRSVDIHTGRDFERLINFSDAVVAVAITVLVLAIVDIRPLPSDRSIWDTIADNSGQLITFLFTFLVVGVMWLAHNRVLNQLQGFDSRIFWLNLLWLAGIAFLPWPSAMYGEDFIAPDGTPLKGVGLFYWLTLAFISLLGWLIARHAQRVPELLEPSRAHLQHSPGTIAHYRGLVFALFFVVIGVATTLAQEIASWMPLLIIPLTVLFGRVARPSDDVVEQPHS